MYRLCWLPRSPGDTHGRIVVKDVSVRFTRPERETILWPVTEIVYSRDAFLTFPELENGGEIELSRWTGGEAGIYSFRRNSVSDRIEIRLLNGGQTLAVEHHVEPIPAPKVRAGIEVEWRDGCWKKLLKKGWVPA